MKNPIVNLLSLDICVLVFSNTRHFAPILSKDMNYSLKPHRRWGWYLSKCPFGKVVIIINILLTSVSLFWINCLWLQLVVSRLSLLTLKCNVSFFLYFEGSTTTLGHVCTWKILNISNHISSSSTAHAN